MGKKARSGSGRNIPDRISESLETFFGLEILKLFDADPGSGIFLTRDPVWKVRNTDFIGAIVDPTLFGISSMQFRPAFLEIGNLFFSTGAPVIEEPQEPAPPVPGRGGKMVERRIDIQPAEDEEDPDDGLRSVQR